MRLRRAFKATVRKPRGDPTPRGERKLVASEATGSDERIEISEVEVIGQSPRRGDRPMK